MSGHRSVADVVVVGTGPSGAIAASTLCEAGLDTVVVDSGLAPPAGLLVKAAGSTLYRRADRSLLHEDRHRSSNETEWFSSLSNGGLSNFWTAAVPRFAPDDFTDGERLGPEYRWPVTYDDLVPFYQRVERVLDVTAGAAIPGVPPGVSTRRVSLGRSWREAAEAGRAAGHGVGAIPMAIGSPWMVARRPREFSGYHSVIAPLEAEGRLRLRPGAHVSRIRRRGGRVHSVEFVDRATGKIDEVGCRSVVLAAGAIDTAMILLRSRDDDDPSGIGNRHDLVGRYLTDHPREWWTFTTDRKLTAPRHPIYIARPPHAETAPLMGVSHTIGLATGSDRLLAIPGLPTKRFGVQLFGTMVPEREHRIVLHEASANAVDDRPEIRIRYDQAAVDTLVAGRRRLRDVLADCGVSIRYDEPTEEPVPGSSVHYSGTARMHDDPQFGVVDGFGRVHGAPDVVVADMSVFTTNPEKNPTLTAMALSARSCGRLAQQLR